ncbi:MAG: hypothetical protein V4622_09550 [Bacteroidota bacterium]
MNEKKGYYILIYSQIPGDKNTFITHLSKVLKSSETKSKLDLNVEQTRTLDIFIKGYWVLSIEKCEFCDNLLFIETGGFSPTSLYRLFYTLFLKLFQIEAKDFEIVLSDDFEKLNENFDQRCITRKSMYDFFSSGDLDVVKVNGERFVEKEFDFEKFWIAIDDKVSIEKAWYSISKKLELDDWDLVTYDFIGLSLEDYYNETEKFISYWNSNSVNLSPDIFQLEDENEIESIVRIIKDWDCNLYLIKYNKKLLEIGSSVFYEMLVKTTTERKLNKFARLRSFFCYNQ